MARFARIPIITEFPQDINEVVDLVNARIDELNRVFTELEVAQEQSKGERSFVPKFQNNLDINQFRLKNVARSRDPQDVVTRRELEEIGILGSRAGGILLSGDLTVDGTITMTGGSAGGSEIATSQSVENTVTATVSANVATARDGQLWVREDAAGVDGTTEGTTAMAVDGSGKQRPLEIRNGGLAVDTSELSTLLLLLIEEVRNLRNELAD